MFVLFNLSLCASVRVLQMWRDSVELKLQRFAAAHQVNSCCPSRPLPIQPLPEFYLMPSEQENVLFSTLMPEDVQGTVCKVHILEAAAVNRVLLHRELSVYFAFMLSLMWGVPKGPALILSSANHLCRLRGTRRAAGTSCPASNHILAQPVRSLADIVGLTWPSAKRTCHSQTFAGVSENRFMLYRNGYGLHLVFRTGGSWWKGTKQSEIRKKKKQVKIITFMSYKCIYQTLNQNIR